MIRGAGPTTTLAAPSSPVTVGHAAFPDHPAPTDSAGILAEITSVIGQGNLDSYAPDSTPLRIGLLEGREGLAAQIVARYGSHVVISDVGGLPWPLALGPPPAGCAFKPPTRHEAAGISATLTLNSSTVTVGDRRSAIGPRAP